MTSISPSQIVALRCTGDTVEGEIRAPKDGERYFALLKVGKINFDKPEAVRHRINFDNLTPLYPEEKLLLGSDDPTVRTCDSAHCRPDNAARQRATRTYSRATPDG